MAFFDDIRKTVGLEDEPEGIGASFGGFFGDIAKKFNIVPPPEGVEPLAPIRLRGQLPISPLKPTPETAEKGAKAIEAAKGFGRMFTREGAGAAIQFFESVYTDVSQRRREALVPTPEFKAREEAKEGASLAPDELKRRFTAEFAATRVPATFKKAEEEAAGQSLTPGALAERWVEKTMRLEITPGAGQIPHMEALFGKFSPKVEKAVFGEEPIRDIETQGAVALRDFGVPEDTAKGFGFKAGILMLGLDLTPAGKADDLLKATKLLTKANDAETVLGVLRGVKGIDQAKVTDDVVQGLVKTVDEGEIKSVLGSLVSGKEIAPGESRIAAIVGKEKVGKLPALEQRYKELKSEISGAVGGERTALARELASVIKERNITQAEIAVLRKRLEEQGNLYTPSAKNTAEIFDSSKGQKRVGETNYELGDFGRQSQAKKLEVKADRFPEGELENTIQNTVLVRRASPDATTHRFDNIAHIAVMPDGEVRAVYTRLNKAGAEEVVNWHTISNERYLDSLLSFGTPDGNRTRNLLFRTESLDPLSFGDNSMVTRILKESQVVPVEAVDLREAATPPLSSPREVALQQRRISDVRDATIPSITPEEVLRKYARRGKTVPQVFRGDKLNLPTEQLADVEKRLSALGMERRTVRTFGEMEEAAAELGIDVGKLLKLSEKRRITDAEVVGLRNLINSNAKLQANLFEELKTNPLRTEEIERQIGRAQHQVDEALLKLVPGGTEAGRAVAAFRIMARNTLDPAFWLVKAEKTFGRKLTPEMHGAILDLIGESDAQGLANFVSMLREPSFAEMAVTLWKVGLLTSPPTHLANIGGNLTMRVLLDSSDVVSTSLDVLASLVTGQRTKAYSLRTLGAEIGAVKKGLTKGGRYLRNGIYPDELLTKWDLPRQVNFKSKILNGYTQAIFRSLGAEDIFFRQIQMANSLEQSATVIAKNEGLKGAAYRARTRELLLQPTNDMVREAIDAAEYATFQSKNVIADMISAGKRAAAGKGIAGELAVAGTEFVAPFVKTPTNIAARIADFSPVGFVKAMVRFARPSTRSQKALVEDLGRAITGTGIIAFGAYLAEKGLMTGNAPEGKAERDQFYAEGKQPHAIRFGDNWLKLDRLSPVGNLLTLGSEMHELGKTKEGASLAVASAFAGVKGLTEQTFLRGVSSALQVVQDPERSAERYLQTSLTSIVPSVIGRTARTIDPTLRVPDGIWEAFEAKLPFLSDNVAPRRDVFGNKVVSPGGGLSLVDPFSTTEAKDHPVLTEATRLGMSVGLPSQTVSRTKMTNAEFSLYQRLQGKLLEQHLTALVNSPDYAGMKDADKEKEFRRTTQDVREAVNDQFFPAIMMKRYNLPMDTNPQVLRQLLSELGDNELWQEASEEKQEKVLKRILLETR